MGDPRIAAVRAVLDGVPDPEIPVVTVVDLGIVRDIRFDGDRLVVTITPTYTGCPATKVIEDAIRDALTDAGYTDFAVETTLSPPWTTDWLSERGREKLREFGIAPPVGSAATKRALFGDAPTVPCPRCRSEQTTCVSEFGSTPCKAHYRCDACGEPFDYFKCL